MHEKMDARGVTRTGYVATLLVAWFGGIGCGPVVSGTRSATTTTAPAPTGPATTAPTAATPAPVATPATTFAAGRDADLATRIDAIFDGTGATVAVRVIELPSRRELYAREADRAVMPASNMKLVTTAMALDHFGPAHRFETKLAAAGDDIYLIGGGDPGLGDSTIATWSKHKPTDDFAPLAQALLDRGTTRVKGNLYYDDRALDEQWTHPSWSKSFREFWYAAPVSGLNFGDNCIDVTVHPTEPGKPVRVEVVPPTAGIQIINNCVTGDKQTAAIRRGAGPKEYVVSGVCQKTTELASKPVDNPGEFAADAFRTYLASRGMTIEGSILRAPAAASAKAEVIATRGTTLADVVKRVNKSSQNFMAEALDKLCGEAARREAGGDASGTSWQAGERAARAFLSRVGVDPSPLRMTDGSGLSRENRVTARMLSDLLAAMSAHPHAATFRESLPIGGVDGSLRKRLAEVKGRVRAKTGTIGGVRSLSGYAETADGRTVAFSIVCNDIKGDEEAFLKKVDEAAKAIVELGGR
jgi:D-alanyl-D-alanine carboxypeptidase/D-alanyl-D-alanine-endopeptidase (penicillin-binding protein 4)